MKSTKAPAAVSESQLQLAVTRAPAPRFTRRTIPLWRELLYLPRFIRNYAEDSYEHHRLLGDVFYRRLGAPSVYLCHPDLVRHVLRTNVRNYVKGPDYRILQPLIGEGILVSEGDLWTRQRRLLAPEFRAREVTRFLPLINSELDALGERWQPAIRRGQPIDVGASLQELALRVVGGALFQSDFGRLAPEIGRAVETVLRQATLRMIFQGLLPDWLPTPGNRRARKAEQWLDQVVAYLIEQGHGSHSHGSCPIAAVGVDIVSRMLVAEDPETGTRMTGQQLIDETKTMLFAGHETTGVAMTWAMYRLARHPDVAARVRDEVERVCGAGPVGAVHVERLVYLRQVLLESMRLHPAVPGVSRTAVADDNFEGLSERPGSPAGAGPSRQGIHVRAGESVTIQCYTLHRRPDCWPEPERFDPERFAPDRIDAIEPYSYLPFLRGRRACLGEHFAMLEAMVTLAGLMARYEFELEDDAPMGVRPITTLRPDRPLSMRIRPRI